TAGTSSRPATTDSGKTLSRRTRTCSGVSASGPSRPSSLCASSSRIRVPASSSTLPCSSDHRRRSPTVVSTQFPATREPYWSDQLQGVDLHPYGLGGLAGAPHPLGLLQRPRQGGPGPQRHTDQRAFSFLPLGSRL